MLRLLDCMLSLFGLLFGAPIFLVIYIISIFDTGSPIFRQVRVGRNQAPFVLFKFRTMQVGAISIASHLADSSAITPLGSILRRTKLDELPQLWNVLIGNMSLVGPRPCLFSQKELIDEREERNIFKVRPGITGLSQLSGIDMSAPKLLAETDAIMLCRLTLYTYLKYIFLTVCGRGYGESIRIK